MILEVGLCELYRLNYFPRPYMQKFFFKFFYYLYVHVCMSEIMWTMFTEAFGVQKRAWVPLELK